MSDLSEMFADLQGCCLHEPQWTPEEVQREITWIGDRHTGSDSSSLVIVLLKPVRDRSWEYGLLTQSEDYTGHGCQCGSMTAREPTLLKLLSHLDGDELLKVVSRDA
jgi:hypothetical protein